MNLKNKVISNDFTVGIIGLGYVGLPLALEFANKGIGVIGFDLDQFKIKKNFKRKIILYKAYTVRKDQIGC